MKCLLGLSAFIAKWPYSSPYPKGNTPIARRPVKINFSKSFKLQMREEFMKKSIGILTVIGLLAAAGQASGAATGGASSGGSTGAGTDAGTEAVQSAGTAP